MAKQTSTPSAPVTGNLASLTAALVILDAGRIAKLKEVRVRDVLERTRTLALGVSAANSAPATDPSAQATVARLNAAGLTPDQTTLLVQAGGKVLADLDDRDTKEQAVHASVATLHDDLKALEVLLAKAASSLRGQFGNTSTELNALGVAPMGGRKGNGRKSKKKPAAGTTPVPSGAPAPKA
jgi:hypothetical protein